ncbi:hypothetical protein ACH9EU_06005 [Kocuria sp. M1R5S2]|uniref:hypothetical protein n=1 Tax=Kocuria rhizosphaerae TaxID=3376285 RepID=UPI00379365F9
MNSFHRTHRVRTLAAVLALSAAAGLTAGCGAGDAPEPGTEAEPGDASPARANASPGTAETDEDPDDQATSAYTGPYDKEFRADLSSYAGQQVKLTGEVADLIPSRSSLVLASPEDPDLDPLLVSARYAFPEAEEGSDVAVTGTVQMDFQAGADQDDTDDEAGFYDRHVGQPYLDQAELSSTTSAGR